MKSLDSITLSDAYGDELEVDFDGFTVDVSSDAGTGVPVELPKSEARKLRDALTETLDESAPSAAVVLASTLSFNEGLMRLAAVHDKTVTFRYAKKDGSVIEARRLQPSEVKESHGHVIFVGYDPDREEPRSYRVDRIKGEVTVA